METQGFYNPELNIRANGDIYGPGYILLVADKDTYTYPIFGWTWFDTAIEAKEELGINLRTFNLNLDQDVIDLFNAIWDDAINDLGQPIN